MRTVKQVATNVLYVYESNMGRMATVGFIFCKLSLIYAGAILIIQSKTIDQFLVSGLGKPHDQIALLLALVGIPLVGQIFIAGFIGLLGIIAEQVINWVKPSRTF